MQDFSENKKKSRNVTAITKSHASITGVQILFTEDLVRGGYADNAACNEKVLDQCF
jgi:hypothetical protein